MSRVGKNPVAILPDTRVEFNNGVLKVTGPLGTLERTIHPAITLTMDGSTITVNRQSDKKEDRSLHGLSRTLVFNMVEGVKNGFKKTLLIEGIGYRCQVTGKSVVFELGYSHPIVFRIPEGIKVKTEQNRVMVEGIDKQLVGDVAAYIRSFRPPEPYKGKGIRYEDEYVRRKAGKTATSTTE